MSTKKVHNYEEASNSMYTTSSLTVGFVGTVFKTADKPHPAQEKTNVQLICPNINHGIKLIEVNYSYLFHFLLCSQFRARIYRMIGNFLYKY